MHSRNARGAAPRSDHEDDTTWNAEKAIRNRHQQHRTIDHAQEYSTYPDHQRHRYLQQLCKHWSHNLAVEFTPEAGKIVFPRHARGADWPDDATLMLRAHADSLECWLEASAAEQLEGLKDVVARHLDRFAFREAPLPFDWQDA